MAKTRFVIVTGGVISGLGKGVTIASTAALFQAAGFKRVTIRKLDPYYNVDPGTMNPIEHGEVFVTGHGNETDLDLGYYERFTGISTGPQNSSSSGQLMMKMLKRERKGEYLGRTIQLIPHFTDIILDFITEGEGQYDVILVEIGGNVGDIEAMAFLEAVRQLKMRYADRVSVLHLTYIINLDVSNELKTKPTQQSVKELMRAGIVPNMLLCRTKRPLDEHSRDKLARFSNLPPAKIVEVVDAKTIYEVPIQLYQQHLIEELGKDLRLAVGPYSISNWVSLLHAIQNPTRRIRVGIVGKYTELKDSYKSLIEAVNHAAWALGIAPTLVWVDARSDACPELDDVDALIVPGGFGSAGTDMKISAIRRVREAHIPFLGICFGMQLAVIEFARSVLRIERATSAEFDTPDGEEVVLHLSNWTQGGVARTESRSGSLGGTMRLGNQTIAVTEGTLLHRLYGARTIIERHRHRYEVDPALIPRLEAAGMVVSGVSAENGFPEVVELPGQAFIATQFHPEFTSSPFRPHPLFTHLLEAACARIDAAAE